MTTKAERRVAIARDVIKQVKAKRFIATPGTYVRAPHAGDVRLNDQLQTILKGKECKVCAKGALFVAKVDKKNAITVGETDYGRRGRYDGMGGGVCEIYLTEFSRAQLSLIEGCFECWFWPNTDTPTKAQRAAQTFGLKYVGHDERLVAICRNIIRHGGTFKP